jgi:hypothetical protein
MIMRTVVELQKFNNKELLNHYERCCRVAQECPKDLFTEADEEYLMLLERALDNRDIPFRALGRANKASLADVLANYNHGVDVEVQ